MDVRPVAGRVAVVRVRMEVLPLGVAVMVKRVAQRLPGVAHATAESSAVALPPEVDRSAAPPATAAGPWAVVIAASVVLRSARVATVALTLAASRSAALNSAVLMTGAPMNAGPMNAALETAVQEIAVLMIGARVVDAFRTVKAAECAQVVRNDLTSVLINNPAVRPVLTAQRVSRTICFGGVMPPRRHWKPVGPSIASGALVRCAALPNSWHCCVMRKRLACWWRKSPGHGWLR